MAVIRKLGVLLMNDTPVPVSTGSFIRAYSTGEISIRDAIPGEEDYLIPWVEIHDGDKTIMVCDRNLLRSFSYMNLRDDMKMVDGKIVSLEGKRYLFRAISFDEWERYIVNKGRFDDLPCSSPYEENNMLWHWDGLYSLCSDLNPVTGYRRYTASYFAYNGRCGLDGRSGLRPVLILLPETEKVPENEYQSMALRFIRDPLNDMDLLTESVMGLAGEAGEALDLVKKHLFQGHELDKHHVAIELGDVAWYLAVGASALGLTLSDIFTMNIEKLRKRYPTGYCNQNSVNRKPGDI